MDDPDAVEAFVAVSDGLCAAILLNARAAASRTSSVMRFSVPSSSSSPHRPQFDSVSKYPSTSSWVGIGRPAIIDPRVTWFGAPGPTGDEGPRILRNAFVRGVTEFPVTLTPR